VSRSEASPGPGPRGGRAAEDYPASDDAESGTRPAPLEPYAIPAAGHVVELGAHHSAVGVGTFGGNTESQDAFHRSTPFGKIFPCLELATVAGAAAIAVNPTAVLSGTTAQTGAIAS
jgi:hypothetical protein